MASGDAQFWTQQFLDVDGNPYGGVRVFHYAVGTTTDKDIWVDAGKSTVAPQPVGGDSFGRVWFYADGEYRLRVESNEGVLLYDWDHVKLSADSGTQWEIDNGTSFPAASTHNQHQMFARRGADSKIDALGANSAGTAFDVVPAHFRAALNSEFPPAGEAGNVRLQTDGTRGVWFDQGERWINLTGEVVNVQEFGALGDGTTNDTISIQAALDVVDTAGGGEVFIPPGTYIVTQLTMGSNTRICGAGMDITTLKRTTTGLVKGMITNKNQVGWTGNNNLQVSHMTLERTDTSWGSAGNFNELIYFKGGQRLWADHLRIVGANTADRSDKGIHFEGGKFCFIDSNLIRGVANNPIAISWQGARNDAYGFVTRNVIELLGTHVSSMIITTGDNCVIAQNVGIGFDPLDTPANFLELSDNVRDVIITQNIGINVGGGGISGGSRILATQNYIRSKAKGTGFNVQPLSGQTEIQDITVTDNIFENGSITVQSSVTLKPSNVLLRGNFMKNSGISIASGSTNVAVIGNYLTNPPNAGILLGDAPGVVCENNYIRGAGNDRSSTATQNGCGIAMTSSWLAANPGVVRGNVSVVCLTFGYYFEQPQHVIFEDNTGWGNVGTVDSGDAATKTSDNLLGFFIMTNGGPTPITRIRHTGPGNPQNVIYGGAGSQWQRNDSGSAELYIKKTGTDRANWYVVTSTLA